MISILIITLSLLQVLNVVSFTLKSSSFHSQLHINRNNYKVVSQTILYTQTPTNNDINIETDIQLYNQLKEQLRGTCLYFIGMMGCGKTSTSEMIAKQLGYRFLDTDQIAEYMIEMPISDFFEQGKESEFRDVEYKILMELAQYTRLIVSTGGGIILKNENWGLLQHGIVIYLDLPVNDIYTRLISNPDELNKRYVYMRSVYIVVYVLYNV